MTIQITDKRGQPKDFAKSEPEPEAPPWFPVFVEFEQERVRQLKKWGIQNGKREDGTGNQFFINWAAEYQRENDAREAAGKPGVWSKILLEEVFEALAETDIDELDDELTQAGAVITAWKEDLAYRRAQS